MSICAQSFDKKRAAREAERAKQASVPMTEMNQYKLMLGKLRIDMRRLKLIKATDKKVELKRTEILPQYADYIDGVLEAASGQQDDVILYNMVWLIDVADYARALLIGKYAIQHGMRMPDRFQQRDIPGLLAEYICNDILKGDAETVATATVENTEILQELYELTEPFDLHDAVKVKLLKAYGLALKDNDPANAVLLLKKVYALDSRSGVANLIKSIEKQLPDAPATETQEAADITVTAESSSQ